MMRLSSRPNIQTMLIFLMLLQLALEVSLLETSKSAASPQDWLKNACMLIMCEPKKGDPRREMAIQGLQQFSSPSELLAIAAPNEDKLGSGTSELELLKLQIKELRVQMDILKATFFKVQQAALAPNGMIVGDKMFKRSDSKGDFKAASGNCARMNGKLALPRNPKENEALKKILEQRNERAILGTIYNTAEKKFKDLNDRPLQFFNWAQGEPNNLNYEKCVDMDTNGQWHDRLCDIGWAIICEFSI